MLPRVAREDRRIESHRNMFSFARFIHLYRRLKNGTAESGRLAMNRSIIDHL